MKRIRVVAARELRAYFNSPIAYVFLLAFVGAALFTFFNINAFFARGQADMRGLFDALPFLIDFWQAQPMIAKRSGARFDAAGRIDPTSAEEQLAHTVVVVVGVER